MKKYRILEPIILGFIEREQFDVIVKPREDVWLESDGSTIWLINAKGRHESTTTANLLLSDRIEIIKQMATITIYQPDGTSTTEEREPDNYPDLKELQAAVGGGLIQSVDAYLDDGSVAYANEEGLLKRMPINLAGAKAVNWPDPLVGPIVVLKGFDEEE